MSPGGQRGQPKDIAAAGAAVADAGADILQSGGGAAFLRSGSERSGSMTLTGILYGGGCAKLPNGNATAPSRSPDVKQQAILIATLAGAALSRPPRLSLRSLSSLRSGFGMPPF
jgi:hypothetical protein